MLKTNKKFATVMFSAVILSAVFAFISIIFHDDAGVEVGRMNVAAKNSGHASEQFASKTMGDFNKQVAALTFGREKIKGTSVATKVAGYKDGEDGVNRTRPGIITANCWPVKHILTDNAVALTLSWETHEIKV